MTTDCFLNFTWTGWYYFDWTNWNQLSWTDCCSFISTGGLISSCDYLQLANIFNGIMISTQNEKNYLFDAVYKIVALKNIYPELDLLTTFWDTYFVNTENYLTNPFSLYPAVVALQQHVLQRGNYDNINEYLENEELIVPEQWADLSAQAGYPIDSEWIET